MAIHHHPFSARHALAVIAVLLLASGATVASTGASSTQPDTLVNDPAGDPAGLDDQFTSAAVRAGGKHLVAAYTDTNGPGATGTGYATSSDGGRTWADRGSLRVDPSTYGTAGRPVFAYDTTNKVVYLMAQSGASDDWGACIGTPGCQQSVAMFRSFDHGVTWEAMTPPLSGRWPTDFEWPAMAVDPYPGPPGSGAGNLYVVSHEWNEIEFPVYTRSTDGGETWEPWQVLHGGYYNALAVGPDHTVYLFAWDPTGYDETFVKKSTDGGDTFQRAGAVASEPVKPRAAVNPVSGDIYVAYAGAGGVLLTFSTDGGATFSPAQLVNRDPATSQETAKTLPSIAVTPDGSKAVLSWYSVATSTSGSTYQRYAAIVDVANGTVRARREFPIGPMFQIRDDDAVPPGEYDGVAAGSGTSVITWTDARDTNAAGERHADIRRALLDMTPPVGDLTASLVATPLGGGAHSVTVHIGRVGGRAATELASLRLTATNARVTSARAPGTSCSAIDTAATCMLGPIQPNGSIDVTVRIVPIGGGAPRVTAVVTHAGWDGSWSNNTRSITL
jgi:hypothetical protein